MSISVAQLREKYTLLVGEYKRTGLSCEAAKFKIDTKLECVFGGSIIAHFNDYQRSVAFTWMKEKLNKLKTENAHKQRSAKVMLTPEQSERLRDAFCNRSKKDHKYDYSDYRNRCEKLVLIYRNQGCEDAVGKLQDLLAGKFGTPKWSHLSTSDREKAINFLDHMIQCEGSYGVPAERRGNVIIHKGNHPGNINCGDINYGINKNKQRGKKMRSIKRNVKTPNDANYDALVRDGYNHDQIINMADDNGMIAKPVEHTSPVESRPMGEIRRMFRLPSPG